MIRDLLRVFKIVKKIRASNKAAQVLWVSWFSLGYGLWRLKFYGYHCFPSVMDYGGLSFMGIMVFPRLWNMAA